MSNAATNKNETRRLVDDPVIHRLTAGVAGTPFDELFHDDGTPRHQFMGAANDQYAAWGGEAAPGKIGDVAAAIGTVLREAGQAHWFDREDGESLTIGNFSRYEIRPGVTFSCRGQDWSVTAVQERESEAGYRVVTVRPA